MQPLPPTTKAPVRDKRWGGGDFSKLRRRGGALHVRNCSEGSAASVQPGGARCCMPGSQGGPSCRTGLQRPEANFTQAFRSQSHWGIDARYQIIKTLFPATRATS